MGFEHEGAVNADTQRLVLEWIAHHAPWPASVRIELRLGEQAAVCWQPRVPPVPPR